MNESAEFIKNRVSIEPELAIVLGSGLGEISGLLENAVQIPYEDIPGFSTTTVPGHSGKMFAGLLKNKQCLILSGRFHYYEGYSLKEITQPIRTMKGLGIKKLLLTNAAGAVNENFKPGDLMVITDHINFAGMNPLIGKNDDSLGPRFFDMSNAYSKNFRALIHEAAGLAGIPLKDGVYAMFSGPSFETPAEIRMARTIGADAVGMSTVPEVIAANHCGIETAAISCITNMAAGILDAPITHQEVMEMGELVRDKFKSLILKIIDLI